MPVHGIAGDGDLREPPGPDCTPHIRGAAIALASLSLIGLIVTIIATQVR